MTPEELILRRDGQIVSCGENKWLIRVYLGTELAD